MAVTVTTPNPGTQQNAMSALGEYQNLASLLNNILAITANLKQREVVNNYSTQYSNTTTYALNPDGSAGAADAAPVHTNPMVGTFVSHDDVTGFTGYIVNDLYDFLTGAAAPAKADRRPAIYGMLP